MIRRAIFKIIIGWIVMAILMPISIYQDYQKLGQAQNTTLNCDRYNNTCELKRIGLWWSETKHFSLQSLQGARIKVDKDGKEKKVILLLSQGNLPMTYLPNPSGSREDTLKQINGFIDRPNQKFLQVHEEDLFQVTCFTIFRVAVLLFYIIVILLPITIMVIAATWSSADESL
jgi:hypothetical protein